ncbi:MAG TPA: ATP-dependent Clp protease proteolytic subunit [Streptosporangiaceae bacterium]|jgi:ATP-dependent Clp protease protease subunit
MIKPVTGSFPPQPPWPPGRPDRPTRPGEPGWPGRPGWPSVPGEPTRRNPALQPTRVWPDLGEWPGRLYDRLLDQRIVIVGGWLDGEAATRLSAQLLTLDAEGTRPIRLELQSLEADLSAALSVMGVLDTIRAPVSAYVSGRVSGPAAGVLAAVPHRYGYPNALLVLSEPRMGFEGTVTSVTAQEEQAQIMLTELYDRLAEATGRETSQIRADAQRQTVLTVPQAVEYGLLTGPAEARQPPRGNAG